MFDYENFIQKHSAHWNSENNKSKIQFYEKFIKSLVAKNRPVLIVETGTMHTSADENAGAFTYIIGDLLHNHIGGKLITVDISEEAIQKCKNNTSEFSSVIEYIVSDSVEYLKNMKSQVSQVDAFFLDSYDLFIPEPDLSEIHHFRELLAVYDDLKNDALIGVDDNFLPGSLIYWNWHDNATGNFLSTEVFESGKKVIGKGKLIDKFLIQQGWHKFDNLYVGESNIFLFQRDSF